MKVFKTLAFGLFLYLGFLVIRFPYQALVDRTLARLEQATGAKVAYTPVSASILGVEMKDVDVRMGSGARLEAKRARLFPGFSGLTAELSQGKGRAKVVLSSSQELTIHLEGMEVETGSAELKRTRANADLTYSLRTQEGKGDILLEVPKFQAPLPIPEMPLELGAKLNISPRKDAAGAASGTLVRAEVHIVGGSEFNADGNVLVEAQPGVPAGLNGTLQFRTPQRRGTLRLEGTWQKPQWTLVPTA